MYVYYCYQFWILHGQLEHLTAHSQLRLYLPLQLFLVDTISMLYTITPVHQAPKVLSESSSHGELWPLVAHIYGEKRGSILRLVFASGRGDAVCFHRVESWEASGKGVKQKRPVLSPPPSWIRWPGIHSGSDLRYCDFTQNLEMRLSVQPHVPPQCLFWNRVPELCRWQVSSVPIDRRCRSILSLLQKPHLQPWLSKAKVLRNERPWFSPLWV